MKKGRCSAERAAALLIALAAAASGWILPGAAESAESPSGQTASVQTASGSAPEVYRAVSEAFTLPLYTGEEISFPAADIAGAATVVSGEHGFSGDAVRIIQGESAQFSVIVPQDARYTVRVFYYDASESTLPASCGVQIDGDYPCYEMRSQQFESIWRYAVDEFETDRYGNEIVPESVRTGAWREKYLGDASAVTMEPFAFELTAGTHQLTFSCEQGILLIGRLILGGEPQNTAVETGTPDGHGMTVIEGERFTEKNAAAIRPTGEYDASVSPYSYSSLRLNMLSSASFSDGGQSVTYTFNVDRSGYYYLAFRYRQSAKSDFPVFRYVLLDGALCTEDFRNVAFDYSRGFTTMTVEDASGAPVGVYFEANTAHTLTLVVSLENMAQSIDGVQEIIGEINAVSLELMKITGNSTSKYRDFDVASYMPELESTLNGWAERIEEIYEQLHTFSPNVKTVGEYAALQICVKQLRSLAADINGIPNRIDELYQGNSSVSQYLANTLESLYSSPLAIDQIYIYQNEEDLPRQKGFFYKTAMSFCRFLSSFTADYYSARGGAQSEHLEIWVNRSRLYVELMQKLADGDFYEQAGIAADFSLMPNEEKLVLATASGNAPDLALGVTYTIPFELAIRGALYELSSFPDWAEVSSRFGKGLVSTGAMDGGHYSLPETSDFLVLFYRKDILDQLGLSVPDTMEDVKEMLPTLKRYGMDFYSHIAGHSGTKTLSVLVPFIYQLGGAVYGDHARDLLITSENTVAAFNEMSDLFSIYDIPYEVSNFYQHFRSGSLPIGISGFNTYMTLLNSAPEIESSWSLAPYPGYRDSTGNIRRDIGGAQSVAVMFQSTEMPDEAWAFLRWWLSGEVQSRFADTLQLTYGSEYMWNTANLEAFRRLPWNEEHKAAILEMLNWITEVPRVPGNYMTQRSLSNALNNIVLAGGNVRQELNEAQKDIRAEIDSKLEEFGYMDGDTVLKDYQIVS